jgi:hypothetical protein
MTVQRISRVGLCASMTAVGDRALDFALELAKRYAVRLDIFLFSGDPFRPHEPRGRHGELKPLDRREAIDLEREARIYHDARLGDFVDVGFRLCEGDEDPELRRCLHFRHECDVLVLPVPFAGCMFGGRPIGEFAESLPCPVVLVGPKESGPPRLNSAAGLLAERLGLEVADWQPLAEPSVT